MKAASRFPLKSCQVAKLIRPMVKRMIATAAALFIVMEWVVV